VALACSARGLPLKLPKRMCRNSEGNGQRSCRQRAILTAIENREVSLWRRPMTRKSQPPEPQDTFQVRKQHLDTFPVAA